MKNVFWSIKKKTEGAADTWLWRTGKWFSEWLFDPVWFSRVHYATKSEAMIALWTLRGLDAPGASRYRVVRITATTRSKKAPTP